MPSQKKLWIRGELVIRDKEPGFVAADMDESDEFLRVQWQRGTEDLHRSQLYTIRRPTEDEIADAQLLGTLPPLKALESIEALTSMESMFAERAQTIKNSRERHRVDELIRRGFSEDGECEWDRRNAEMLVVLALKPESVGWWFKVRERLHAPIHAIFHKVR